MPKLTFSSSLLALKLQIVLTSTTAFLAAGRFGLAPSVKKSATAGLKLVDDPEAAEQKTGDPAGFTAVDCLGLGALGHIAAVGIILGLKGTGQL